MSTPSVTYQRNRRVHVDDIAHLASYGIHVEDIAARIGVTRNAVYVALRRAGEGDLADDLARKAQDRARGVTA